MEAFKDRTSKLNRPCWPRRGERIMAHLRQAIYFAPRGKSRLMDLGRHILTHYFNMDDRLIGFVGGPGAGKSLLVEGMLKDFVLTNDDKGVNIRPLPLIEAYYNGYFKHNVYHLDAQFEMAFYSADELVKAVNKAIAHERRVFIEHFERLYPMLGLNAQVLIGIGEEVIVTRPGLFGPDPAAMFEYVRESLIYRKMAHTAEELVSLALQDQEIALPEHYSEVQHGFIMEFRTYPSIDLQKLEQRVNEMIAQDLPIKSLDPEKNEIWIGDQSIYCTGPRVHVNSTGKINDFRLSREIKRDPISQRYLLIGRVGTPEGSLIEQRREMF